MSDSSHDAVLKDRGTQGDPHVTDPQVQIGLGAGVPHLVGAQSCSTHFPSAQSITLTPVTTRIIVFLLKLYSAFMIHVVF